MTTAPSRANVVSSFTIIKGSLIDETYAAFQRWDLDLPKDENLRRLRDGATISGKSANWLRDVSKVLNRRFDPSGRDRPLVELAHNGCPRDTWKPLLLWHMTRDEYLLRDFLTGWLYDRYVDGTFRLRTEDVVPYLQQLSRRRDVDMAGTWTRATTSRVASGLLRIAADFGILTGTVTREFASYHLPDDSLLYLLHAVADAEATARGVVHSPAWRMFLMGPEDVERELLRLHQFRRLRYEVAGSLVQLDLPCDSPTHFAQEMTP